MQLKQFLSKQELDGTGLHVYIEGIQTMPNKETLNLDFSLVKYL